jgi:hypothetical protein
MRDPNSDRRTHPRGADILTYIEDVTYRVLRRLEAESLAATDEANRGVEDLRLP